MEYEFDDMEYDTGYGVEYGTLVVDCDPIVEDCRFDAYNKAGGLSTYGGYAVTGVKNVTATIFLIGNNGVELGEATFDSLEELVKHWPNIEEDLIEKLNEEEELV